MTYINRINIYKNTLMFQNQFILKSNIAEFIIQL